MASAIDFPVMPTSTWEVSAVGVSPMLIVAPNWLAALGLAIHRLGPDNEPGSLACEVLRNGAAVVNDFKHHRRYVIRLAGKDALDREDEVETPEEGPERPATAPIFRRRAAVQVPPQLLHEGAHDEDATVRMDPPEDAPTRVHRVDPLFKKPLGTPDTDEAPSLFRRPFGAKKAS